MKQSLFKKYPYHLLIILIYLTNDSSGQEFKANCGGKADGKYWHPWECEKYVVCVGEQGHEEACPTNPVDGQPQRFDPQRSKCGDANKIPCALAVRPQLENPSLSTK